ncbi:MAG: hypothetical protein R6V04_00765 [bacterium]
MTFSISGSLLINSAVFSFEFDREDYAWILKLGVKLYETQQHGGTEYWYLSNTPNGDGCHLGGAPDFCSHPNFLTIQQKSNLLHKYPYPFNTAIQFHFTVKNVGKYQYI